MPPVTLFHMWMVSPGSPVATKPMAKPTLMLVARLITSTLVRLLVGFTCSDMPTWATTPLPSGAIHVSSLVPLLLTSPDWAMILPVSVFTTTALRLSDEFLAPQTST